MYCGLSKNGQGLIRTDSLLAYYNILFTSLFFIKFRITETCNSQWVHNFQIEYTSSYGLYTTNNNIVFE